MTETDLDRILAQPQSDTAETGTPDAPMVKLVVVSLGDHWFAFHGEKIREILGDCPVFFLPGCPASLEGVINVRGDIESVLGLRTLLGHGPQPSGMPSRILVAEAPAMRSGLRVDRVEDVVDVPEIAIQAPPHSLPDHLRPIVQGIVSFRDHLVHVLDLDRLFADYRAGLA